MKLLLLIALALLTTGMHCVAAAEPELKPLYTNNFEGGDKTLKEFLIMSGGFEVKEEGTNKFLELPGSPLDTFGLLFGPAQKVGASASARFFGTKQGRKFPSFGISLNGVGGYRLQMSPAKKALEIFKGDEAKSSVPFDWTSGAWTKLRVQVSEGAGGVLIVEGKAWLADAPEPVAWTISLEEKEELPPGRAGIWGSPYSGTPIRFDDLALTFITTK